MSTLRQVRDDIAASGHGHVVPRRDGLLARCGGPGLCRQCSVDQQRLNAAKQPENDQ